jgi:hypothetical protein
MRLSRAVFRQSMLVEVTAVHLGNNLGANNAGCPGVFRVDYLRS